MQTTRGMALAARRGRREGHTTQALSNSLTRCRAKEIPGLDIWNGRTGEQGSRIAKRTEPEARRDTTGVRVRTSQRWDNQCAHERPYAIRHNSKRGNLRGRGNGSRQARLHAGRVGCVSPAREGLSADRVSIMLLASADVISKYTYVVTHVKGAVLRARAVDQDSSGGTLYGSGKECSFGILCRAH